MIRTRYTQMQDVLEKFDMNYRIVKLSGVSMYRIQRLEPSWFGFGPLRWKIIKDTNYMKPWYSRRRAIESSDLGNIKFYLEEVKRYDKERLRRLNNCWEVVE